MLAAAAEATWTECEAAVAKNLQDQNLEALFADQYSSISKKVLELRKVLESPNAKPLLSRDPNPLPRSLTLKFGRLFYVIDETPFTGVRPKVSLQGTAKRPFC